MDDFYLNFEKIQDLIKTGFQENIDLAFEIASSLEISESELLLPWQGVFEFAKEYHLKLFTQNQRENLFFLTNLDSISLPKSKVDSLPEQFGYFRALVYVNLFKNKLKTIPESIGLLSNLVELNLMSNQLTQLPESIGQLENLTELYLSNNQLSALPNSIHKLKKLKSLYINDNPLSNQEKDRIQALLPTCNIV